MSVPFAGGMHEMHHYAEDLKRVRVRNNDGPGGIHGLQNGALRRKQKALYREFAVKLGDNHVVVLRRQGAIDDKQVAVVQANVLHAVALRAQEKGACPVGYKIFVEIELLFRVVLTG